MNGIILTLVDNELKVSINSKTGTINASTKLDETVATQSKILNPEAFAKALQDLLVENIESTRHKLPLNILLGPETTLLRFLTVNKKQASENLEDNILSRVGDIDLEKYYYSYQKIAPFVYQFVAVEKDVMEALLTVSTNLGYIINSIFPWVGVLPKLINDNNPSIFLAKQQNKQVLALSELNGIYHTGIYESDVSAKDLQEMVQQLAIYKREEPIKRIFTINNLDFAIKGDINVERFSTPVNSITSEPEFELHNIFMEVVTNETLLHSQLNLLNVLPTPVVQRNKTMVAVGTLIALLAVGLGGYFSYDQFMSKEVGEVAGENINTQTVIPPKPIEETKQEEPKKDEINKKDLQIRIENGAGIAGIAGTTQTTLEELGYTVVSIGNSEEPSRETTLIKFKNSKETYRLTLVEDLKDKFELVLEGDLPESTDYDVLIVVGQN
ncbi:MAG: LytR C-terminal domain-containing protein [Patescibacteria group bacterium]|uniref:LytR C-terminal domain-containing protein n=1 Tax=candidate division WWE3 bacterium TaxID=2053526 RepID=A0A955EAZ1_UNCKA|nr:LytR C-terminal domain-containing protein [candidate division WWE3 bacterium]